MKYSNILKLDGKIDLELDMILYNNPSLLKEYLFEIEKDKENVMNKLPFNFDIDKCYGDFYVEEIILI